MSSTFNGHHTHHHQPKREPNENGILYPPSPSLSPPTLKVNKDSHVIKKPPSPSSSSSAAAAKHRHPVIIYTHTPKIIHTNPKDFMALVQKLTGMSPSDEDPGGNTTTDRGGKSINQSQSVSDLAVDRKNNRNRGGGGIGHNNYHRNYSGTGKGIFFNNAMISDDSESSSVITTDENGGGGGGEHGQVNSSIPYSAVAIPPPPPHPPPPPPPPSMYDATGLNYGAYLPTFPMFPPATNPADSFLCGGGITNQTFASIDDQLYLANNMRSSFSSSSSSGFDGLAEFRDF
ncbi:PREDICTED: VQ motif-containing protein 20-like [Camelina sativa]|uniref:VQ motif-containing protein 20-like n=2 Tax=Camelina sativa TaxID=90675 RepID=A0ABM0W5E7_CAMSA|nr:PREDICTED: VQ motif-containing protein 20-like [Camelina sativa]